MAYVGTLKVDWPIIQKELGIKDKRKRSVPMAVELNWTRCAVFSYPLTTKTTSLVYHCFRTMHICFFVFWFALCLSSTVWVWIFTVVSSPLAKDGKSHDFWLNNTQLPNHLPLHPHSLTSLPSLPSVDRCNYLISSPVAKQRTILCFTFTSSQLWRITIYSLYLYYFKDYILYMKWELFGA